jgi:hypothetical protein
LEGLAWAGRSARVHRRLTGDLAPLPRAAKWLLAFATLGRLGLLTVLVLLTPEFWGG